MNIKVEYARTDLENKIWEIQRKLTTTEYEPKAQGIEVKGLKPLKDTIDWENLNDCKKQTGLTEAEYQAKHRHAWSE